MSRTVILHVFTSSILAVRTESTSFNSPWTQHPRREYGRFPHIIDAEDECLARSLSDHKLKRFADAGVPLK
jgi:hypothetical protein